MGMAIMRTHHLTSRAILRNVIEVSSWKCLGGLNTESLWLCAHAGALAHASGKALNVDSTGLCWFSGLYRKPEGSTTCAASQYKAHRRHNGVLACSTA